MEKGRIGPLSSYALLIGNSLYTYTMLLPTAMPCEMKA
jgi:hypothetical protein